MSEDLIDYLAEAKDNAAAAAKAAQALSPLAGKTDEAIRRLTALEGALRGLDLSTIERATSGSRAAAMASRDAAEAIKAAVASLAQETASLRTRRPRDYVTTAGVMGAFALVFLAVGWTIGVRHADDQVAAAAAAVRAQMAAAAAWAGTPSGLRAQKLDQAGALNVLTTCNGENLKRGKDEGRDACLAQPGFVGWYLD